MFAFAPKTVLEAGVVNSGMGHRFGAAPAGPGAGISPAAAGGSSSGFSSGGRVSFCTIVSGRAPGRSEAHAAVPLPLGLSVLV
jgi:hypothetical protein